MDTNLMAVAQAAAIAATQANSNANINTIVVALIGLFGVVITTIGTVLLAKINASSKETKISTAENGVKLEVLTSTTREIHKMVNKPFGVALETAAAAMETVAKMTNDPQHRKAAEIARTVSNEHNASMEVFDMNRKVEAALAKSSVEPID